MAGAGQLLLLATLLGLLAVRQGAAQTPDVICAESRFTTQCEQMRRGESPVRCQLVQDSVECAQLIRNGTANFGVFTAESALQIRTLGWPMTIIKELRHQDRRAASADFESVVIVRSNQMGGLSGLRGATFCHPGLVYNKQQRWTERFLKHFERTVVPERCNHTTAMSPAELEVAAMAEFFGPSCRPGLWSNNLQEDIELKQKYPSLCASCDVPANCSYLNPIPSHEQALYCASVSNVDAQTVTYVSLSEAQRYFEQNNQGIINAFSYLCPNGTHQQIQGNLAPCTWLRQPWRLLMTKNEDAVRLSTNVENWIQSADSTVWAQAFREIIQADSHALERVRNIEPLSNFFIPYRPAPVGISVCSTTSKWCTTSVEETDKCLAIRAGGISTGVYPTLECVENTSGGGTLGCLREVNEGRADLASIDSNFGYLARHPFNLTSALFAETERYSEVVVLLRASSPIDRFENLKGTKACIAEFSGIAAMAFINVGKSRGFFNKDECDYGRLLSEYFSSACAPGALNVNHNHGTNSTEHDNLCGLCRMAASTHILAAKAAIVLDGDVVTEEPSTDDESTPTTEEATVEGDDRAESIPTEEPVDAAAAPSVPVTCNADATNLFYGNRGALQCLSEVGDVAILERQYLHEHARLLNLNPLDFVVLCRNGSRAAYPGFDVDADCLLTKIVDGEVVARRDADKFPGTMNALISLDKYLQSDPKFNLYNHFNGVKDLLFKDTTFGLEAHNATDVSKPVQNYRKLFEDLEKCAGSGASSVQVATMTVLVTLVGLKFLMV